jgi:rod shape-determining protein MreC
LTGGVSGGLEYLVLSGQALDENKVLREEAARLRAENGFLRETLAQFERMNAGAVFAEMRGWESIPAEVVSWSGKPWPRSLIVNKGRESGISLGDPALNMEGLAGVVVRVSRWTSTVQLLSDTRTAVGALVSPAQARGVVTGTERADILQITLENRNIRLREGQRVISSGMRNSLYPRGLPIGVIGALRKDRFGETVYEIVPYVNFEGIQDVLILKVGGRERWTESDDEEETLVGVPPPALATPSPVPTPTPVPDERLGPVASPTPEGGFIDTEKPVIDPPANDFEGLLRSILEGR